MKKVIKDIKTLVVILILIFISLLISTIFTALVEMPFIMLGLDVPAVYTQVIFTISILASSIFLIMEYITSEYDCI